MPVFRCGTDPLPAWCGVDYIAIRHLPLNSTYAHAPVSERERIIAGIGDCRFNQNNQVHMLPYGTSITAEKSLSPLIFSAVNAAAALVIFGGNWQEPTGTCGAFTKTNHPNPENTGDPVDYPHKTDLDNHYHDCDEFWVIINGSCRAVSEGHFYDLKAGECLLTPQGYHHDMAEVVEKIDAVYFETSLKGAGRQGHLWTHTHGPAKPEIML